MGTYRVPCAASVNIPPDNSKPRIRPVGIIEVDVVDLALVVAGLGEHPCPEQRLVARDDRLDLGSLLRGYHALAPRDDHRVAAEADDFREGHDERTREEPSLVRKQSDDGVVAAPQDDVPHLVHTLPVRQAQERLADHALALAHHKPPKGSA